MHRHPRHGAPRARQDSSARAGDGEVTAAPRTARHAAPRGSRAQRAAAALAVVPRARAGRVVVAGVLGLGVVAAATGAVTASGPATTAGGSSPALVEQAPVALPSDGVDALRSERAAAADHRRGVRAAQAAEAAARAAAEREAAERAAAEEERRRAEQAAAEEAAREQAQDQAAAEEAQEAREEEAASRSAQRDPRAVAASMVGDHGWGSDQMSCLDQLWTKESSWQWDADNPTSSAYGIPQALPGEKMAEAGADWETNPVTQIRWGLDYIDASYGTPCGAWSHSQANDWY